MSTSIQLHSERVVVDSPMSFTGSAKRLRQLTRPLPGGIIVAVPLILLAWVAVAVWYVVVVFLFGVLFIPWRLLRRHQRLNRRRRLQHREHLAVLAELEQPRVEARDAR